MAAMAANADNLNDACASSFASPEIANLSLTALESPKQQLGSALPKRERRALCCSVVGFCEPLVSGLGFGVMQSP